LETPAAVNVKLQNFQVAQVLPKGTSERMTDISALEIPGGDRVGSGIFLAVPNLFGEKRACSWRATGRGLEPTARAWSAYSRTRA